VLLIHGTGGAVWDPLPELLDAAGFRAIWYHRRGFGESTYSPIKDPPRHTRDAAALLEALDAVPAIVVGHSMGGVVSLDLAVRRPDVVRALVVIEPPLHFKNPSAKMLRSLVGAQITRRVRGNERAAESFMRWATSTTDGANGYDATPPEVQAQLLGNAAAIMRELDAGTGEHVKPEEIGRIECPVVCLIGGITLPDYGKAAQRIVDARPSTEIVDVPGAGHILPASHPEAVVEAVSGLAGNPALAS
jgi:pimeloyl-ACP methyl ester carboxylesterase